MLMQDSEEVKKKLGAWSGMTFEFVPTEHARLVPDDDPRGAIFLKGQNGHGMSVAFDQFGLESIHLSEAKGGVTPSRSKMIWQRKDNPLPHLL